MKKSIFYLFVTVLLLAVSCLPASAAVEMTVDSTENINGAVYTDYSVYGEVADNTADVHIIEFTPESGLFPLAYAANAGTVSLAQAHIDAAISEGYTVVGAINGSFFEMATGNPCGTLISDGKLVFTHAGLSGECVAVFDYEGNCDIVTSTLAFNLKLDGKAIANSIGLVNKKYSACGSFMNTTTYPKRFHYYDIDACDLADETVAGYEIVCEKLDGTDIAVGKTLKGKVLEIRSDSYYGKTAVEDDSQFVLFVKSDSGYVTNVESLAVDSEIEIIVNESVSASKNGMNNAVSGISSSYWLVKDGKDITDTTATIIHSTSLARAWTAFGVKEDGSFVYFAGEEYGLTLKDVADAMIELGCTDVIRLDGGGSTSIYVDGKGSPITTTRAVCDMLLIVEKADLKYGTSEEPETSDDSSVESVESENSVNENESEEVSESSETEDQSSASVSTVGIIFIVVAVVAVVVIVAVIVAVIVMLVKRKK